MKRREIVFRAWLKKAKIMLEAVTVYRDMIGIDYDELKEACEEKELSLDDIHDYIVDKKGNRLTPVIYGDDWVWIEFKDLNLMQYIGEKDCKKKQICEGDIMKVRRRTVGSGKKTRHKDFYVVVEYYSGGFHLPFYNYGSYRFQSGSFEHHEVVGNFFQNKNLLRLNPK